MSRFATTTLLIGDTGTGKTTEFKKLVEGQSTLIYTRQPNDKGLADIPAIAPDKLSEINGVPEMFKITELYDHKKVLNSILNGYFNGNLMFDDIRPIMKSNISGAFEDIIGGVRHNGNDLFFSFWHLNDVPPFLYQMVKHIMLFKQSMVPFEKSTDKIPRFEEITRAHAWVMQHANPHAYAYICTDSKNKLSMEPFSKVDNY